MVYKWELQIPKLMPELKRRAYLYLPACYDAQPDARFPVMYMFDGHNVFFDEDATYGKSWGMAQYMDETQTPLIIAAVECNPIGNNRLEEYCPFTCEDPKLGRIRGRGRTTMNWFIHGFKPMIDANLRTLPDRANTLIAGSSMGGLMSLYAATAFNSVFGKAVCLSPSLWLGAGKVRRIADLHGLRRAGNGQPCGEPLRADLLHVGAAAKGRRSHLPHRPRRHAQRGLVGAADSRVYEVFGVLSSFRLPFSVFHRLNPPQAATIPNVPLRRGLYPHAAAANTKRLPL